ncbi:DUF6504 family protein [Motilibacter deserti]|uniref:DUF6504 domain-containing protein n=1 Tax=Motilibacter deserti TaxID=2714956 RepID=A0ABX0GRC4_9ACTN|nr:DUF6504 family protein [Motilibacter deserti]NHC12316.1 hypothetical protein [Motilibacter deserti]
MRRYDDPVDVRRRDDAPEQFLWRGKLYVVRDVLAHWVETGAWWRAPAAQLVYGTDEAPGSGVPATPSMPRPASASDRGPAPVGVGASGAPDPSSASSASTVRGSALPPASSGLALEEAGEREMWRVEASAGRAAGSGVFDLAFDWAVGGWRLTTALD